MSLTSVMAETSLQAPPLAENPLFLALRSQYVQTVQVKAAGAAAADPNFRAIVDAATRIDGALQMLGRREVPHVLRGANVLHQLRFAMLAARDFCDQYDRPAQAPFQEPYGIQWRQVAGRLHALATLLTTVAMDPALPALPKATPVVDTLPPGSGGTAPLGARSLRTLLADDIAAHTDVPCLAAAAAGRWMDVETEVAAAPRMANSRGGVYTLLHMAALWQCPYALAMLLGHGADPETGTAGDALLPAGSTALHLAAAVGHAAGVRLLLGWGADGASRTNSRDTPPSGVPSNAACREAFKAGPELREKALAACSAAHKGHGTKFLEIINDSEVPLDVKFKRDSRFFLVHHVVHYNDPGTLALALEAGASPLLRTSDGLLPSKVAASYAGNVITMAAEAEAAAAKRLGGAVLRCAPASLAPPLLAVAPPPEEPSPRRPSMSSGGSPSSPGRSPTSPGPPRSPTSPKEALSAPFHLVKKGVDRVRRMSRTL